MFFFGSWSFKSLTVLGEQKIDSSSWERESYDVFKNHARQWALAFLPVFLTCSWIASVILISLLSILHFSSIVLLEPCLFGSTLNQPKKSLILFSTETKRQSQPYKDALSLRKCFGIVTQFQRNLSKRMFTKIRLVMGFFSVEMKNFSAGNVCNINVKE